MSDKPFDTEAFDTGGHACATNSLSDMKTHIENALCYRPFMNYMTFISTGAPGKWSKVQIAYVFTLSPIKPLTLFSKKPIVSNCFTKIKGTIMFTYFRYCGGNRRFDNFLTTF
jgi:hypothetical protein